MCMARAYTASCGADGTGLQVPGARLRLTWAKPVGKKRHACTCSTPFCPWPRSQRRRSRRAEGRGVHASYVRRGSRRGLPAQAHRAEVRHPRIRSGQGEQARGRSDRLSRWPRGCCSQREAGPDRGARGGVLAQAPVRQALHAKGGPDGTGAARPGALAPARGRRAAAWNGHVAPCRPSAFLGDRESPKNWLDGSVKRSSGELCQSCPAGIGTCQCRTSEARCKALERPGATCRTF